jgi:translation initiation factor IF-3
MRRRTVTPAAGDDSQYRINHQIRIAQILVIGPDGDKLGIMSPDEARNIAAEHGLDLVEVAPNAKPPVCRIMDFGKFRYEQAKKAASSKAARVDLKELRLRPKTDDHDMETMVRKAKGFIAHGDRVRLVMRLRGREQSHAELWLDKLAEIMQQFSACAQIAQPANIEGKMITGTIEPISGSAPAQAPAPAETPASDDK